MEFPEYKVVPGSDGKVWLCFAVDHFAVVRALHFFVEIVGRLRAVSGKVQTAASTRFREEVQGL